MRWFNFLKKRTIQQERDFALYDTHSHILWGVDDGASQIEDSVAFLKAYARLGYQGVVATPHLNHWMFETFPFDVYEARLASISSDMEKEGVTVKIGGEVMCRDDFVSGFDRGLFLGVGDTWLVEFENRPGLFTPALEQMVFNFRMANRTLILAHPERYGDVQKNPSILLSLKERGMLMQINLGSLVGKNGHRARQLAWMFVDNGMADLAATDVHRLSDFSIIESALERLAYHNPEKFRSLVNENPGHVFNGQSYRIA
ncbi:MAG: hypothetical protein JXR76_00315 [Deltaproteobacteria bacterium]|nr:hypothetical protein [Deltaproteobacteria bacterium]